MSNTSNKLTKVKFVVIGSLINVATQIQKEFQDNQHIRVDASFLHICTSVLDVRDSIPHIMIGNGQGSGGDRAESFEFFKKNKSLLESEFKDENTLYVVLGGGNGGTSTAIPMTLPLIGQKALLMMLTEDATKGLYRQNTLKTYQSIAGYAQKKRSVPLFISKVNGSVSKSDSELLQYAKALGLFLSPMEKMDENDVLNLFRFDKLVNIKSQKKLYEFKLFSDKVDSAKTIATRELVLDGKYTGSTEEIEGELVKQGHTPYLTKMYTCHKLIFALIRNSYDSMIADLAVEVENDKQNLIKIETIEVPVPSNVDELDEDDNFIVM